MRALGGKDNAPGTGEYDGTMLLDEGQAVSSALLARGNTTARCCLMKAKL
jgi:hypothetical protein